MNLIEAQTILLRYRPGTADAEDPQVAEALALAKTSPELARWWEAQSAGQTALRGRFQAITPPAGLKAQILSEFAASQRPLPRRRMLGLALAVLLLLLGLLAIYCFPPRPADNTLVLYQNRMIRTVSGPYAMDLLTNDPVPVRAFLAQHQAPANFTLPTSLQHMAVVGCAIKDWHGAKVSLICFRTGKPLPPGMASDLWLFVVDRASVPDASKITAPQFDKVSGLITATWTVGDKIYLLGGLGQEADLRLYLL